MANIEQSMWGNKLKIKKFIRHNGFYFATSLNHLIIAGEKLKNWYIKILILTIFITQASCSSSTSDQITIDFSQGTVCKSKLGGPLKDMGEWADYARTYKYWVDEDSGFELGMKEGKVDYVFLTMTQFKGRFIWNEEDISLASSTSIQEVLAIFGEPYWNDDDDDEKILFYEINGTEIQFEFPGKEKLGYITFLHEPLLADPDQRSAYGVTKNWPPEN